MLIFGVSFFVVVSLLSLLLKNPPEGYVAPVLGERRSSVTGRDNSSLLFRDAVVGPKEMVKTPIFWMLWALYFIGAGLMVIGSVAGMAKASMGANAFLAVAILAMGNAGGRVAAGMLSDRIGRKTTLLAAFALQSLLMLLAIPITGAASDSPVPVLTLATLIGFNYGANLSLFPSYAKDLWGMKHFGVNYGLLFTAWGCGGLALGRLSESFYAHSGFYQASFIAAGALLALGTILILVMRDRKEELRRELRQKSLRHAHA